MAQRTPVRLAICVDGTLCDPDGSVLGDRAHRNVTNVYRLYASIQNGLCTDSNGKSYQQKKKYFDGIASESDRTITGRLKEGIFGKECLNQVQAVYQECCRLDGPEDEVWLYGFSRGAWVVRAVAGLLHYIRALSVPEQVFEEKYKGALKAYHDMQKQSRIGQAKIHHLLASRTRPAPTIKFVGVFDTVKALDDSQLFNISFNDSINHMRQALALNEDRAAMLPEYLYPTFSHSMALLRRTFIQSWFVGAHIDIGGSSKNDGLSLYPLQWMLLESRDAGLCLRFDGSVGGRIRIDDPLELTGLYDSENSQTHTISIKNRLKLKMVDIRSVHTRAGYAAQINRTKIPAIWTRVPRKPFTQDGHLEGDGPFASHCTIIHPSVYLLIDKNKSVYLDVQRSPFCRLLEGWRINSLGWDDNPPKADNSPKAGNSLKDDKSPKDDNSPQIPKLGFWNKEENSDKPQELGAIRILVCGNTGVGKSSLINSIFGVKATETSHLVRGVHNVNQEITWPNRPDIIIHDSGGFEAAGVEEFKAIEDFLRRKSTAVEVDDRLHAIWLCLETNNSRPTQRATENLFRAIDRYAQGVPVLVIATKKDEFEAIKDSQKRRRLSKQNESAPPQGLINEHVKHELQERLMKIQEEILRLPGARFNACVAVSIEDDESIKELSKITTECFTYEKVMILWIRAQISRIDLKIDLAVYETMRIYKDVLASAVSMAGVPLGSTTNRFASAIELFRVIINCFGMPSVTPRVAYDIFKSQLFEDLGGDFAVLFAEYMSTMCAMVSVASLGMPFFLIPMATNIPLVVPAAERLILMLACDLILVFSRCFQEASQKYVQPNVKDLERAVAVYKNHYKEVHRSISKELPKRNVFKFFRVGEVQETFKKIIEDFKKKVMGEPRLDTPQYSNTIDHGAPRPTPQSGSSISPTIGADAEDPDQAGISDDDREVIKVARKSLGEYLHEL